MSNKYKEALEKIQLLTHYYPKKSNLEDTYYEIARIATEAFQSESEVKEDCEKHRFICLDYPDDGWKQCMYCKVLKKIDYPKSESRMYSEENMCGFAEWFTTEDYIHSGMEDGEWFYRNVKHTKEELLRIYLNSLQPKTEEVRPIIIEESPLENEWRKLKKQPYIPTEKEQPTSPSIEKEADEYVSNTEFDDNKPRWENRQKDFIEGYKANNSLRWVKCNERMPIIPNPLPKDTVDERGIVFKNQTHSSVVIFYPSYGYQPNYMGLGTETEGWSIDQWEWLEETQYQPISENSGENLNKSKLEELENWVRKKNYVNYNYERLLDKIQELKTKQ